MKREGVLGPKEISKTAAHWRMRGEEIRTIAEGAKYPSAKSILLGIAADYDRLAEQADERAALDAKLEARLKNHRRNGRAEPQQPAERSGSRAPPDDLQPERFRARRPT
jgi:hypothetical protein